jgi:hypothetical protein
MRLALLVLLFASSARADDDTGRARAHYEIGNGMYRLGDYQGALREFAAGWELTKKPGFLINLGQTYRKLHDPTRAREMYRQYLSATAADDPSRAQVQQVLGDLDKEIEALPAPSPAPPQVVVAPVEITRPAPPPPHHPRRGLQIGGIVLGVVGLGVIGGGGGAAAAAEDTAQQLTTLDRNRATFDGAKDDRYHLDRALEYSLFAVGAAVTVTGIVLIAMGSR